jgi:predicted nucleic acid-binding protein
MIAAVLDTNAIVSGILGYDHPARTPGELLRRWRQGAFTLILSPQLLAELDEFRRWIDANGEHATRPAG